MSMFCPHCADVKLSCIDSRQRKNGSVRRRYRCDNCERHVTTLEEVMIVDAGTVSPRLSAERRRQFIDIESQRGQAYSRLAATLQDAMSQLGVVEKKQREVLRDAQRLLNGRGQEIEVAP